MAKKKFIPKTLADFPAAVGSKSVTVPDQSLTVKEILTRFTRGQAVPGAFYGDDDPQDLSDEELMSQQVLEPFDERQMALEFEEQDILGSVGAAERQPEGEANSGVGVKASEQNREISASIDAEPNTSN